MATSSSLASIGVMTSEELVKALKAAADPPTGLSVSKSTLAAVAWQDQLLRVPRKAELLSEWALDSLCRSLKVNATAAATKSTKGKGKASEAPPPLSNLLDVQVWQLLEATLRALPLPTRNALAGKHNVLLLLASTIAQPALASEPTLLAHTSAALALLLPAATARASHSIDAIADAIVAMLEALPRLLEMQDAQVEGKVGWTAARACAALLGPLVVGWIAALELGSNSKKASRHFLSNAVSLFLAAHERVSTSPVSAARSSLLRSLEQLSREALFSAELLSSLVASPNGGAEDLFAALRAAATSSPSSAAAVLHALPALLTQLTSRLALHRATLFPVAVDAQLSAAAAAATQVAQERKAALQAFVAPAFALLESLDGSIEARATSRAALLKAVESHSLYIPGGDDASAWRSVLKAAGEGALADLQRFEAPTGSVEALLVLSRLADSVAAPLLPTALATLAPVATATSLGAAAAELLGSLCNAASSQREVPQLVALLFNALDTAASEVTLQQGTLPSASILRGPLMAQQFKRQLSTALSVFIAPAQVLELLPSLRAKLSKLLERFSEEGGGRETSPRGAKRAKTTRGAKASADEAGLRLTARVVCALRLVAGVMESAVLPLPMRVELSAELKRMHEDVVLRLLDATQEDAVLAEVLGLRSVIVARVAQLDVAGGAAEEEDVSEDVRKPALWLDVAIDARLEALLEKAKSAKPELLLAVTRTVLERIQREGLAGRSGTGAWEQRLTMQQQQALGALLVEATLAGRDSEETTWDGEIHGLSSGAQSAQATWSAIAWEWAANLDAFAQTDVLERLVRDVLLPSLAPKSTLQHLAPISKLLIANAAFLELRNWAKPLFSVVVSQAAGKEKEQLAKLLAVAQLPVAYWSAAQRTELESCAWKMDAYLAKMQKRDAEQEAQWAALRRWMTRLVARQSSSSIEPSQLVKLIASVEKVEATSALQRSTMSLFDALTRQMLSNALRLTRSSAAGMEEAWEAIVSLEAQLAAQASTQASTAAAARVHLVELVLAESGGKAKHVPAGVLGSLATALPCSYDVASSVADAVKQQLQAGSTTTLKDACRELRTLCTRLSLSQVASSEAGANKGVAQEVLLALTGSEVLLAACNAISAADEASHVDAAEFASQLVRLFAICLRICSAVPAPTPTPAVAVMEVDGEVQQVAAMEVDEEAQSSFVTDRTLGARVALAFASLISAFEDRGTLDQLSTAYTQCSGATSAAEYDATLSTVRLAIVADEQVSAKDRAALLSTAGILLRNGPEGTLTIAQRHWTRLLSSLRARIAQQPALTLPALEVVEQVCSGKAMLLRLADAGILFALLSDLVGARTSPESTSTNNGQHGSSIFNAIVTLLASLIRLRPDIVAPLLPHLTILLSQLLSLLPALRPEAGLAHAKSVHSKLPAWLDVSRHALASTDARVLARLFSALTSKSTTRPGRGEASSASLKSASLARGFSKHAPYVLAAHVRSLVAPTTFVGARVRAELKMGLFALCDVIGTHERDALMVAHLDAGERALLKEIWAEWEAQRYKGQ